MAIYGTTPYTLHDDQTDRIGIRTLTITKLWQAAAGRTSILELDDQSPPIPSVPAGLVYVAHQTRRDGGGMRTSFVFEGVFGNGKDVTFKTRANSIDYNFEAGFAQVSILLHPSFAKLQQDFGGSIVDGQVIWPATIGGAGAGGSGSRLNAGGSGRKNPLFGVTEYLRMEGTYNFRYACFSVSGINTGSGKIFTSASLPGGPPPTTDGRNWIKVPSVYRRRGPVFDVSESYWLSGNGGWPPEIYGTYSGGRLAPGDASGNPGSGSGDSSVSVGSQGAGDTGGVNGGGVGFSQSGGSDQFGGDGGGLTGSIYLA